MDRKLKKGLKIAGLAVTGLLVLFMAAVQFVLSPKFLEKTASRLAPKYIDGELKFSSVRATAVRSFPCLDVTVRGLSLTYPHDRFPEADSSSALNPLAGEGRAEPSDTLVSIRSLHLSLNYLSLLRGRIRIRDASLDSPRLFASRYAYGRENWDIFLTRGKDISSSGTAMPEIIVHNASVTGNTRLAFADLPDTLVFRATLGGLSSASIINLADLPGVKPDLTVDSLNLHGLLPSGALNLRLSRLSLTEKKGAIIAGLEAEADMDIAGTGSLHLPAGLWAAVSFPGRDFSRLSMRELEATLGTVSLTGEADIEFHADSTYIRAEVAADGISVRETVSWLAGGLYPEAKKLKTDATVSVTALCDGWYRPSDNSLPELVAQVLIPPSTVSWEGIPYDGRLALDLNAESDASGRLDASLDNMDIYLAGISLRGTADAADLLGPDPFFGLKLGGGIDLGGLQPFLPDGLRLSGNAEAAVEGRIRLSDKDDIYGADLSGHLQSSGLEIRDEPDTVRAYLGRTRLAFGPENGTLAIHGTVDSLYGSAGSTTMARGRGIKLSATLRDSSVSGTLAASRLAVMGADSMFVGLRNTTNRFSIAGLGDSTLRALSLNSSNGGVAVRYGDMRTRLDGLGFGLDASKAVRRRPLRRERRADSLTRSGRRMVRESAPDGGFIGKDLNLSLGDALTAYYRNWNFGGSLYLDSGLVMTPKFPLRNSVGKAEGTFSNDAVRLSNLTVNSGESDLSASCDITGMRRALLRGGKLALKLKLSSGFLNANELAHAYDAGSRYRSSPQISAIDEAVDDGQFMSEISAAEASDTARSASLIVIPANIDAEVEIEGERIKYSDLDISWFSSEIKASGRTLQLTNTLATSNMGDIYFEGFYSTRSADDIRAGFDINLVDITADKVITLFPAVDSLMPMLKSFKGMLDCEMAATSSLDTNMNLITSSIAGVMKIKGSDLSISDNPVMRKLSRTLMFKDKNVSNIRDMHVEGIISDNTLEIFPFILGVDRYTLAMNGLQNFDQSFKYHISVLQSPVPFRFGINLYGNFDDWKYKIGKAMYRNTNVPAFTTQINEMQVNLVESIHNIFTRGVDAALSGNTAGLDKVEQSKKAAGYSDDAGDDLLDREQMAVLDSLGNQFIINQSITSEDNGQPVLH